MDHYAKRVYVWFSSEYHADVQVKRFDGYVLREYGDVSRSSVERLINLAQRGEIKLQVNY